MGNLHKLLVWSLAIVAGFCLWGWGGRLDARNSAYTTFSEDKDPGANSYRQKRKAGHRRKLSMAEKQIGRINAMKTKRGKGYHESESFLDQIKLHSPPCFIEGPDKLAPEQPGMFHVRTTYSPDKNDLTSGWDFNVPINMSFDSRVLGPGQEWSIEEQAQFNPVTFSYAKSDGITRWGKEGEKAVHQWAEAPDVYRWADDPSERRWQDQGGEVSTERFDETYGSTELTFHCPGPVTITATPIVAGGQPIACNSKMVDVGWPWKGQYETCFEIYPRPGEYPWPWDPAGAPANYYYSVAKSHSGGEFIFGKYKESCENDYTEDYVRSGIPQRKFVNDFIITMDVTQFSTEPDEC